MMSKNAAHMSESIALPPARLAIGITGHRDSNAAFFANRAELERDFATVFAAADAVTNRQSDAVGTTRLHSLLALGADMIAVEQALERNWDVVSPLPFGLDLNIAINADPLTIDDATALLEGRACADKRTEATAAHMRHIAARLRLFELAEQDAEITRMFIEMQGCPHESRAAQHYYTVVAERVAAAGRVMIEQSDLLVAVWDGVTPGAIGGTRHTISAALKLGLPVIWVDAAHPGEVAVLSAPEELFALEATTKLALADIEALFEQTLNPPASDQNERAIRFHTEQWHRHSYRRFHAYRRVEALFGGSGLRGKFGGLVQKYETPAAIAGGSGAKMLAVATALPGGEAGFADKIKVDVLERFAWADGLSTYLSDAYRGGMTTNFLLAALAIIVGVAYLPLASVDAKWPFALMEFILLTTILAITTIGRRRNWHGRWFETRRVAEYFRHAPIMLLLGVARSTGRWPRGADTEWPEYYAREVLREIGLPSVKISQAYLRAALEHLLGNHATRQRIYHEGKAQRLTKVHHGLDRTSERLFTLAVLSVASYLTLLGLGALGIVPARWAHDLSKTFTFLGVILPALGGAFAGIRYFGDFERFAAISEVTAEKLQEIETRIATLLNVSEGELRYAQVADLTHAVDDVVVSEIENWQSVFGGKQIAVPV